MIDPGAASSFITAYSLVLAEAYQLSDGKPSSNLLAVLASGREAIGQTPDLLQRAIASLEARGTGIPAEFRRAISSLRLRQWVYLKDTTKYSVFLDPERREAYAVVGLTGPIRGILGGADVTFRAGVVDLRGRYVCDGILGSHVWLGPNYKREFRTLFATLKREAQFHVACEP